MVVLPAPDGTHVPFVTHGEFLAFVDSRRLWGCGLGAVDLHLAASCVVTPGVGLWTRDRRLRRVAGELGIVVRAD
ncbi:MAG: hypothetical protein LBS56_00395 [Propionibacteriaceae bacterium]|jgi:hypothetical protein|nr:hypothetical protein [Propionibacteriaceae bacterium]